MSMIEFDRVHIDIDASTLVDLPDGRREAGVKVAVYGFVTDGDQLTETRMVSEFRVTAVVATGDEVPVFERLFLLAKREGRNLLEAANAVATASRAEATQRLGEAEAAPTGWLSGEDMIGAFYAK